MHACAVHYIDHKEINSLYNYTTLYNSFPKKLRHKIQFHSQNNYKQNLNSKNAKKIFLNAHNCHAPLEDGSDMSEIRHLDS